ncbi:MAG TPA: ANTAR domain-containing protein [Actinomycetospora sp.]|nr:ANTAR domain-containing protein [Actinomycetospora sp.]
MTDHLHEPPGWSGPEVHQAEGALHAWLGVSIHDATHMLQLHAHRAGVSVQDVARQVLERGLIPEPQRLDPWGSC